MKRTKKAPEDIEHTAIVVSGAEGTCLYIDGYRVAGPKPWGGGRPVHSFKFTGADLKQAERTRRANARATRPSSGGEK